MLLCVKIVIVKIREEKNGVFGAFNNSGNDS